jgi:hypothetical protein
VHHHRAPASLSAQVPSAGVRCSNAANLLCCIYHVLSIPRCHCSQCPISQLSPHPLPPLLSLLSLPLLSLYSLHLLTASTHPILFTHSISNIEAHAHTPTHIHTLQQVVHTSTCLIPAACCLLPAAYCLLSAYMNVPAPPVERHPCTYLHVQRPNCYCTAPSTPRLPHPPRRSTTQPSL